MLRGYIHPTTGEAVPWSLLCHLRGLISTRKQLACRLRPLAAKDHNKLATCCVPETPQLQKLPVKLECFEHAPKKNSWEFGTNVVEFIVLLPTSGKRIVWSIGGFQSSSPAVDHFTSHATRHVESDVVSAAQAPCEKSHCQDAQPPEPKELPPSKFQPFLDVTVYLNSFYHNF